MFTKILANVSMALALFASPGVILAGDGSPVDEVYESFAQCTSDSYTGGYMVDLSESTSSGNALMVIEGFKGPDGDGVEFSPRRVFGIKVDADVRDPIVLQYSFMLYKLFISLERSDDGTYPAELRVMKDDGEYEAERLTCRL